jgi:Flp pilus assembly protein TadG
MHTQLREAMDTPKRMRTGRRERGAELFELALVLPMLLLLVAGAIDFAQGWSLRQILANGARDGARLGSSENYSDLTTSSPGSIQEICQQVADYLIKENVNVSFMGISGTSSSAVQTGCSSPSTITNSSGLPVAWTYYSSGTYGLKIEPQLQVPPPGSTCGPTVACITSSRVTLIYPFKWTTMGATLFGNGSNTTIAIQVYSIMPDLGT